MNPLTVPYDENGNQAIYPWPEDGNFGNPLEPLLYSNQDETHQFLTNNFISVDVPFVPGLSNRVNVGLRMRLSDYANYMGRDTRFGFESGGEAETSRSRTDYMAVENVLSYNRDLDRKSTRLNSSHVKTS